VIWSVGSLVGYSHEATERTADGKALEAARIEYEYTNIRIPTN